MSALSGAPKVGQNAEQSSPPTLGMLYRSESLLVVDKPEGVKMDGDDGITVEQLISPEVRILAKLRLAVCCVGPPGYLNRGLARRRGKRRYVSHTSWTLPRLVCC